MIEHLLPPTVATATSRVGPDRAALFPEEEAVLARAVEKRRKEFAAVRSCARRALADLGHPPAPILPGPSGMPCWPEGIVGSMTHCDGFHAAALARAQDVCSLGIDAEPHEPLPRGVLGTVGGPEEQAALRALDARIPGVCWDRLLFSAKESVYKIWFPITRRWLGFEDASVDLRPDGSFTARILPASAPFSELRGRWAATGGLLVTAIVLPAAGATPGAWQGQG